MCVLRKMKNGKFKLCGFQTSNAEQMEKHMSICETQRINRIQFVNIVCMNLHQKIL